MHKVIFCVTGLSTTMKLSLRRMPMINIGILTKASVTLVLLNLYSAFNTSSLKVKGLLISPSGGQEV